MNKAKLQKFSSEFFATDEFQEMQKKSGDVLQENIYLGHRIPAGATLRIRTGLKKK